MRAIHRWPMNSPHKRPVTRKMFPFDDVIIYLRARITLPCGQGMVCIFKSNYHKHFHPMQWFMQERPIWRRVLKRLNCVTCYLGPLLLTWFNLKPAWISNYIHYKGWDEIAYLSPNFNGAAVEFTNGYVISSRSLLGMWLLIYTGIEVNPC